MPETNILLDLACLFVEVRQKFFEMPVEDYTTAMSEIGRLAKSAGYTINQVARLAQI
jgi:hypothetical protein